MKVNKRLLKQIVKECLIEILSEGLGSSVPFSSPQTTVPTTDYRGPDHLMMSSKRMEEAVTRPITNPNVASAIRELSNALPGMSSIFEDTARSTLMMQNKAENDASKSLIALQGDRAAKIVDAATPEQIFGEDSMSKWAELAFAPSMKKP